MDVMSIVEHYRGADSGSGHRTLRRSKRLTLLDHVVAELQQNAGWQGATVLYMLLVHPTVLKSWPSCGILLTLTMDKQYDQASHSSRILGRGTHRELVSKSLGLLRMYGMSACPSSFGLSDDVHNTCDIKNEIKQIRIAISF
jgi:hypothetical protein